MGLELHKCNCQLQKASDEGVEDPVHVVCSIASEAAAFKGGPIRMMQDSFKKGLPEEFTTLKEPNRPAHIDSGNPPSSSSLQISHGSVLVLASSV